MMPPSNELALYFDIRTYWLHSSGAGGGADYDLVMERDPDDLPFLGGRQIAGLLRLALKRAAAWDWFDNTAAIAGCDIPDLLMGGHADGAPGCLDVRSATVAEPLRASLLSDPAMRAACFQRMQTTAIETAPGIAREGQLRSIEAAMPLPLQTRIRFLPADSRIWSDADAAMHSRLAIAEANWRQWIGICLPALDEVGAKRTRGFGQVHVTVSQGKGAP